MMAPTVADTFSKEHMANQLTGFQNYLNKQDEMSQNERDTLWLVGRVASLWSEDTVSNGLAKAQEARAEYDEYCRAEGDTETHIPPYAARGNTPYSRDTIDLCP
jgi:hypothetical protein